jgi:hypothetical protein
VPPRKRSGTVVVPLIQTSNLNTGFGAEMPGNSGLIMGVSSSSSRGASGTGGALGGAVLQFEIEQEKRGEGSTGGRVSVLAAAAQIERRNFSQPPSPMILHNC